MKQIIMSIAIIMAVALLSCGKSNRIESADVALGDINKVKQEEALPHAAMADSSSSEFKNDKAELQKASPLIDWDKKIIKTANINLEVQNFKTFNSVLHINVRKYGAYIASEQQNESDSKVENIVSIKVPVAAFEDLINGLPADGVKINEKRITTDDVTAEMVDTKARTEAKKQAREQYLGLLKKAKNMKDVIEVQHEIDDIQGEIESGTGRAKYLTNQAAYSTINLSYFQFINGKVNDEHADSFATKLKEAFATGSSVLSGMVIVIATVWPVILAAFLVWFVVKNYSKKRVSLVKKDA